MQPDPSPPPSHLSSYSENKSTRKYVKTGKYSKKKQQQQQQQIQAVIQQQIQATLQQRQQPLTPQQILALQQSLQDAAVIGSVHTTSGTQSPIAPLPLSALSSQTLVSPSTAITPPQTVDAMAALQKQQLQQQQQLFQQQQHIQTSSIITTSTNGPTSVMPAPASVTPANDPMIRLLTIDGPTKRTKEVDEQHIEVKRRCMEALTKDHEKVSRPDYFTPFRSIEDAMERLLPYHIYQYPASDLDANKVPLDRQDQTMLDIYKCQKEVFEKHGKLINKKLKEQNNTEHQILLERLVSMDMRQKINEEQARVGEEQRAQQQALRIQADAEKARALQEQQQQLMQQQQYQQQHYQYQQPLQQQPSIPSDQHAQLPQSDQPLDVKYAQTLNALMQNKEFAEQYQKLTPALRQQFLLNLNHDKVAEFLKRSS